MLQVGKLRHRVNLQSSSSSQDDFGEVTYTWSTDSTVWASINPLMGRELYQAQQVNPELTHKVIIRYASTVTPDDRVIFGSRTFEIISVLNYQEKGEYLELLCKEVI